MDYHFYMQFQDGSGETVTRNIETDYIGAKYKSLTGIESYGKQKVSVESYAENGELSIRFPTNAIYENMELVLTLYFFGDNRRDVYHQFQEDISNKKVTYWDTCRNRKVTMYLSDKTEPSNDILYGNAPYIEVPFKFTNIKGHVIDF